MHELLRFINDEMGRLGKPDSPIPYLRLRTRIESLREDRRYGFLFASEEDALAEIVGRLLRIPAAGKPLAIVDLSGVPSEIGDVVVSVLCRIVFDFSMWSQANRMPPLLLICEEAHRYVPADKRLGFEQTSRIITQIAKEGRKYGISLGLISQRPSELAPAALSQCGTVFALRLGSDVDQQFIARTMPDVAAGMLTALPSLPTQQAIVSGEAVRVPMRIRFDDVPESRRPRSEGAQFSSAWLVEAGDDALLHDAHPPLARADQGRRGACDAVIFSRRTGVVRSRQVCRPRPRGRFRRASACSGCAGKPTAKRFACRFRSTAAPSTSRDIAPSAG